MWNQGVDGVILSNKLHKFVFNPKIPPMYENDRSPNIMFEGYESWIVLHQALVTRLLSTISESVSPRVLACKHAYEV